MMLPWVYKKEERCQSGVLLSTRLYGLLYKNTTWIWVKLGHG